MEFELRRGDPVRILHPPSPALDLAVADLARDFQAVLGSSLRAGEETGDGPLIVCELVPGDHAPEAFSEEVLEGRVILRGGDILGLVFALYDFSGRHLGVSPLGFWEDRDPRPLDALRLPGGRSEAAPPRFRFRGWFLNDEDLLCEFWPPSGRRALDYPFYGEVINLGLLDKVCEALLRCRGNLLIPASFLDVMNPAEAALAEHVVRRGLFVSQHHIEPLGVSAFAFEAWSRRGGAGLAYSFKRHPGEIASAWEDYAGKWRAIGGDRVIWQVGLRGKGDWAVWQTDPAVHQAEAGELITSAVEKQRAILRRVTGCETPPATFTLWNEGASLLGEGRLRLPEELIRVHCDEGPTQEWTREFFETPRLDREKHGAYLHLAYWDCGPHLVEGVGPETIRERYSDLVARGDTEYVIWNVSNIREFTRGIAWCARLWRDAGEGSPEDLLGADFPSAAVAAWRGLCALQSPLPNGGRLQDGRCLQLLRELTLPDRRGPVLPSAGCSAEMLGEILEERIAALDRLLPQTPEGPLRAQAEFFSCLLRALRALCGTGPESPARAEALRLLTAAEEKRRGGLGARWRGWYRGDRKFDLPRLIASLAGQPSRVAANERTPPRQEAETIS